MLSFCKNTNNNKMSNKKSESEMYDITNLKDKYINFFTHINIIKMLE